jgi:hypothetical protein
VSIRIESPGIITDADYTSQRVRTNAAADGEPSIRAT